MEFGRRDNFAIDVLLETSTEMPLGQWGRLRVWVRGVSIGDFEDPLCSLHPAYSGFCSLLGNRGNLWEKEFSVLASRELWNLLDGAMYGVHLNVEVYETNEENDSDYWKYNFLTNWGEMFDQDPRGKAFLFEDPSGVIRVLTPDEENKTVETYNCERDEFYECIRQFCEWFDEAGVESDD